ncbi:MAG: hypothetical protein AAGC77_14255 [Pseudomonadota bacterium]
MGIVEIILCLISAGAFATAIGAYLAFADLRQDGLARIKTSLESVAEQLEPNRPWRSAVHGEDETRRHAVLERDKDRLAAAVSAVIAERNAAQRTLLLKALGLATLIVVASLLALLFGLAAAQSHVGAETALSPEGALDALTT